MEGSKKDRTQKKVDLKYKSPLMNSVPQKKKNGKTILSAVLSHQGGRVEKGTFVE